ncbi:MAG: hypothetical protein ACREIM_02170 [Nitrospiraceae bacterium]
MDKTLVRVGVAAEFPSVSPMDHLSSMAEGRKIWIYGAIVYICVVLPVDEVNNAG